jgi:hypothetical protein
MPKTLAAEGFSLAIEYYREEDGRWPCPYFPCNRNVIPAIAVSG